MSWLHKNADTRKIDTIWDAAAWESRSDIDPQILALILSTYRSAESTRPKDEPMYPLLGHDIAHTIEMVALMEHSGKKLEKNDIQQLCHGYGGDTMFALSDAIISMDIALALDILHRLTATSKVDEWLGSWMGSLRNTLYIRYLRTHGEGESDIIDITRLNPYTVKK